MELPIITAVGGKAKSRRTPAQTRGQINHPLATFAFTEALSKYM